MIDSIVTILYNMFAKHIIYDQNTFMKYFGLMTMLCYCVPSENIDIINISFIIHTSRACNNCNSCSIQLHCISIKILSMSNIISIRSPNKCKELNKNYIPTFCTFVIFIKLFDDSCCKLYL